MSPRLRQSRAFLSVAPPPTAYHPMPAGLRLKGLRGELATYCGIALDDSIAC